MTGEIQSGTPSLGGIPLFGDGWVQLEPGGKKIAVDQLSPSEQELILQYLYSQLPVLAPPQDTFNSDSVTAAAFAIQMQGADHDVISAMLDKWVENIRENAEQSKKQDEKKAIDNLSNVYHTYQHIIDLKSDPNFPIFAVGMIIAGTGIVQSLLPDPSTSQIAINPVLDMYNKALATGSTDMINQLGMAASIYTTGFVYFSLAQVAAQTSTNATENGDNAGAKPKGAAFAKGYAENIMSLVSQPGFNNFLMAIITKNMEGTGQMTEERIKDLLSMAKAILLSSALAMLYIADAGKMTSIEFAGMLSGNIVFDLGDIRAKLVGQINKHLSSLSPADRETTIAALLEYFDSNPTLSALSNPATVFAGIYNTLPRSDVQA